MTCRPAKASRNSGWWTAYSDGNWKWGLGTVWLKFSPPDATGWCMGEAFAEVPMGAKRFSFAMSPNMKEGETVYIDNVHVWKLW